MHGSLLAEAQIADFLSAHFDLDCDLVQGAAPRSIHQGSNSLVFLVGPFLLKEIFRAEIVQHPALQTAKYDTLDYIASEFSQVNLPIRTRVGGWFQLQDGRIYEAYKVLDRGETFAQLEWQGKQIAQTLAHFHNAADAIPSALRKQLAANDLYRDTLKVFELELDAYAALSDQGVSAIDRYVQSTIAAWRDQLRQLRSATIEAEAAATGILHRDAHPDNFWFFGHDQPPLLLDFDSMCWSNQLLDVAFAMDRFSMNRAQLSAPADPESVSRAEVFLHAYYEKSHRHQKVSVAQLLSRLREEYLKRTGSILKKHYLDRRPQDLENLQRQSLTRLEGYATLIQRFN